MVSVAALCPGWFAARVQIKIKFTPIIQAYDRATPIVITVTVSSLVGIDKQILECNIDDIIAINMKKVEVVLSGKIDHIAQLVH